MQIVFLFLFEEEYYEWKLSAGTLGRVLLFFCEEGVAFEGFDVGDVVVWDFDTGGCCGVEAGENCGGNALDVACDGVYDSLLHGEAAIGDTGDGGQSCKRFVEVGWRIEAAVDVDDGDTDASDGYTSRG